MDDHWFIMLLALVPLAGSLTAFYYDKNKLIYVSLAFAGILVFAFAASLDSFLNVWDERFHALVAKNLMNHFLIPTLYDDPVLDMVYYPWDRAIVWLQKQPLFLWQIACSFKLFGVSELTLRLPSVIHAATLVLVGYRTGKLLVNSITGFCTALLILSSNYLIELVAGRQELDHNDISFITYISLSIWAFCEYYFSANKRWIIAIGIFSGMAVLCKWLVGLWIYLTWIVVIIAKEKKQSSTKALLNALFITIVLALPWQLYTFVYFPKESLGVYIENASHFSTVLHGHDGSWWYHFNKINLIYGAYTIFLLPPALFALYKSINSKILYIGLLSTCLFVYLFFTMAATKMPSFTAVNFLFLNIALGSMLGVIINFLVDNIKNKYVSHIFIFISIVFLMFSRIDVPKIHSLHFNFKDNSHSKIMTENTKFFKSINLSSEYVIFNLPGRHFVECMFYTGLPGYNGLPSLSQYHDLIKKGRKIAIINYNKDLILPDYLLSSKDVKLIVSEIKISE